MSYSDDKTEQDLISLEKRIKEVYEDAYIKSHAAAEDYFEKYEERYNREWEKWKAGQYTDEQFKAWTLTQLSRGSGWEKVKKSMADKYVQANQTACSYINGATPSIFALNANFAAYEISEEYESVMFDLVDENVVKNLITDEDNYTEFKTVDINPKRDYSWNSKQIQSALTSSIIRGESIDKMADSFMVVMQKNRSAAVRNARTACTSAQNAGRISTMKQAKAQGIDVQKRWLSAHDGRVRDSHAHLDGQIRDVEDLFDNGLLFPADSNGTPAEVYNCRCTLTYIYPKYDRGETSTEDYSETKKSGESYQEWLKRMHEDEDLFKSRKMVSPSKEMSEQAKKITSTKNRTEQMKQIGTLCSNYISSTSNWNGKITDSHKSHFDKRTGSIHLTKNATIKTKIHEYLHSCTDNSNRTFETMKINGRLNEGVTEYLAEEICKAEGISYNPTYRKYVKALRNLAKEMNVEDIQLAKTLMTTEYSERYNTLESLCSIAVNSDSKNARVIKRNLRRLYGSI